MFPPSFVVLDKPAGMTSSEAVNQVKRKLRLTRKDKIGHAGTLDPDATGVLVCAIGRATKLIPVIAGGLKEYVGTLELGVTTTTDDLSGEVLARHDGPLPDSSEVLLVGRRMTGVISQVPPQISACKVQGERAYAIARRGERAEVKAREVFVSDFELTHQGEGLYSYRVVCGGGTYVRALARDLGAHFQMGGAIKTLRRTRSYPFGLHQVVVLDDVAPDLVIPWFDVLDYLPTYAVDDRVFEQLAVGNFREAAKLLGGILSLPLAEQTTVCRLESSAGSDWGAVVELQRETDEATGLRRIQGVFVDRRKDGGSRIFCEERV